MSGCIEDQAASQPRDCRPSAEWTARGLCVGPSPHAQPLCQDAQILAAPAAKQAAEFVGIDAVRRKVC